MKSTGDEEDVIEEVTAKTLGTLINNIDNLVVVFCEYKNLALILEKINSFYNIFDALNVPHHYYYYLYLVKLLQYY